MTTLLRPVCAAAAPSPDPDVAHDRLGSPVRVGAVIECIHGRAVVSRVTSTHVEFVRMVRPEPRSDRLSRAALASRECGWRVRGVAPPEPVRPVAPPVIARGEDPFHRAVSIGLATVCLRADELFASVRRGDAPPRKRLLLWALHRRGWVGVPTHSASELGALLGCSGSTLMGAVRAVDAIDRDLLDLFGSHWSRVLRTGEPDPIDLHDWGPRLIAAVS